MLDRYPPGASVGSIGHLGAHRDCLGGGATVWRAGRAAAPDAGALWPGNARCGVAHLGCCPHPPVSGPRRQVAQARHHMGEFPVRSWEQHLPMATSLTQGSQCSICQCPRPRASRRCGSARYGDWLVSRSPWNGAPIRVLKTWRRIRKIWQTWVKGAHLDALRAPSHRTEKFRFGDSGIREATTRGYATPGPAKAGHEGCRHDVHRPVRHPGFPNIQGRESQLADFLLTSASTAAGFTWLIPARGPGLARQCPDDVPEVGCFRIAASLNPHGPALLTNQPRVVLTSEVRRLLTILLTNARTRADLGGIWRHSARSKVVGPVGLEPTT